MSEPQPSTESQHDTGSSSLDPNPVGDGPVTHGEEEGTSYYDFLRSLRAEKRARRNSEKPVDKPITTTTAIPSCCRSRSSDLIRTI